MRNADYIPKATKHASGQAVVRLSYKDHYLGRYGSATAKAAYGKLIAEWLSNGRCSPANGSPSVNELILAFARYAATYYPATGRENKELGCIRQALKIVKALYGTTPAVDFGPKALKACRQRMVEKGWCRTYVNHQVDRVRRMFRWGGEEEIIPGTVYHNLQTLRGIRKGMPGVRESEPVKPVPETFIEATLPFMPLPVAAMVELQRLTAMRPGEVVTMRSCDLETSGRVWIYRPQSHKTQHHGHSREIYMGPKAQEIIRPYLNLDTQAYLFSPAKAEALRNGERRRNRKSPMTPSQAKRRPKRNRKRPPGEHYDVASYRRAIRRACGLADIPEWHPNQLRHNAATRLRKEYGIELARIILGHATAFTTEIYAEADRAQAVEVISRIG